MSDQLKAELCDIYDLWHTPFWQTTWFLVLSIMIPVAIVVGVTVYFVVCYMSKKRKVSAWERALQELRLLKIDTEPTKDQGKRFYFQLTGIVKKYLHARFDINIVGKTDKEVCNVLKDHSFTQPVMPLIDEIFSGVEFIKYADSQARVQQMHNNVDHAISIVEKTRPLKMQQ